MIHFVCDSMSDMTPERAAQMNVTVVPLHVHFGQEDFRDGIDLSHKDFYERLVQAEQLPKTSQASPEAFHKAFEKGLVNLEDEVLCITGSSRLSGTYQSAMIARNMTQAPERVYVVDSLSVSLGTMLIIQEALKLGQQGLDAATIKTSLEQVIPHLYLCAQVDDLKYLVMGGRLSAVGGKVGTVLKMKPMIKIEDGNLATAGICRGKSKVHQWFVEQMDRLQPDGSYPMIFASTNAPEAMEALLTYVKEQGRLLPSYDTMGIGSVIGCHAGPGAVAACWVRKN